MAAFLEVEFFDVDGNPTGLSAPIYLPDYLDRRHIKAKAFWFKARGFGEPSAKWAVLKSQGQRLLVEIDPPLQQLRHNDILENENGLEQQVREYVEREGIGFAPLNQ